MTVTTQETEVLDLATWGARAAAHEERLAPFLDAHLARRKAGEKHPVRDFLFGYYSYRPAQLRRWHPGFGVRLEDDGTFAGLPGYEAADDGSVTVSRNLLEEKRVLLTTLRRLLAATAARPAHHGCFGLHEWAMVYRLEQDGVRHASWPLRLGGEGTDAVVESHRIACTHFDAYRFFTEPARPLNTLSPASHDRADFEQPGCLHAGMDLYKHAFRLSPLVPADLVADCFELAVDIRTLDMQASPYDLAGLDDDAYPPVRIETAEGKRAYAAAQAAFTERAAPLRSALLAECERLLAALEP
ncbi:3-methyladenine DNA glycosylase [Nocardioides bruguierae]|uniref:3-methyladenine DNA glycosylase n=1 Tax=Nocardioides bruguierae TaxID=2945102 RepID=UPI0020221B12|nr:3-methyladenine DNA glycosylase [Nocardioides bruguierae]MCL8026567.1 3-methyladenine DNA glycosylase [Nocardioides bruguierae]